jgi:hypothetical protein
MLANDFAAEAKHCPDYTRHLRLNTEMLYPFYIIVSINVPFCMIDRINVVGMSFHRYN